MSRVGHAWIGLGSCICLALLNSACPGGDCGSSNSDDSANCYPLKVEIFEPAAGSLQGWKPPERSGYSRTHGT